MLTQGLRKFFGSIMEAPEAYMTWFSSFSSSLSPISSEICLPKVFRSFYRSITEAPETIFQQNRGGGCRPSRPGELGCFHLKQGNAQNPLEWPKFENCYLPSPILLNTPPLPLFCWFFFRNVTELYGLCNDTCFLFVRLRNLADYIIIPFLTYGMLRNLTNCAMMLPFDFRCVTEPYGLCINTFFRFPAHHGISQIA